MARIRNVSWTPGIRYTSGPSRTMNPSAARRQTHVFVAPQSYICFTLTTECCVSANS